ncbi:uncharacterized protein LOC127860262 isoform X4 [Dreissena polymorpha]|uniref:Uncharacterized protein n=1 Tax=Dreissena polymorpha TaxID=45954 RepID=A0A9D3YK40_DREPO|nr:uncharacterized protein LOC127860262 isoform X2 [Dreissena polymorpha]XP_052254169.1 uncharacterized protein LOC127860262 isoform X3 [Dreissena polymorpha]XP_052254170.1 uncharacterized protein LOC127860262 isoform X4 [Dreissena polymorpha]KAH3699613.1 hypothetical protein DPMN_074571 [Dreissena polymorpha]
MSKFVAAIRKFFSKTPEEKKEQEEAEGPHEPNKYQKAEKKPRMYDEVVIGDDGTQAVKDESPATKNLQEPPPRAPRQYEEVDLPTSNGGPVIGKTH